MSFIVNDNKNLLQKSIGPETYLTCSYKFDNTGAGTYALTDQNGNYLVVSKTLIVEALMYSVTNAPLVGGTNIRLGSVNAQTDSNPILYAKPNENLPDLLTAVPNYFGDVATLAQVNTGVRVIGNNPTSGVIPLPGVAKFLVIQTTGTFTSGTINIVVKVVGKREL